MISDSLFDKVIKWLIPTFIGLIIFSNHYVRDSLGALEKQLEEEANLSPQEYSLLNSLYFFPNIITPLIAGMFIDSLGGVSKCFFYSVSISSLGHLIFSLGLQYNNHVSMYAGKALAGTMYEIVDALMPITYLGPMFGDQFPVVVGLLQVFLRSGSVVNFFVSPIVYDSYGLKVAMWLATFVAALSIPLFILGELSYQYLYKKDSSIINHLPSSKSNKDNHIVTKTKSTMSWKEYFFHLTQLDKFSKQFYFYMISGTCLYGSIVPFWFFGSKYMQETLFLSVNTADSIMTIPEGLVVLIGFPLGLYISKYQWSISYKLLIFSISQGVMTMAYIFLLFVCWLSSVHGEYSSTSVGLTVMAVVLLGLGFSFACTLFWGLINGLVEPAYLSAASGIVSCAVNLLPTILLPVLATLMTSTGNNWIIASLGITAGLGCLFGFISASDFLFNLFIDKDQNGFFLNLADINSRDEFDDEEERSAHHLGFRNKQTFKGYEMVQRDGDDDYDDMDQETHNKLGYSGLNSIQFGEDFGLEEGNQMDFDAEEFSAWSSAPTIETRTKNILHHLQSHQHSTNSSIDG